MAGLSYYTIAGRQVGSHHIAMAWLGTLVGGVWYATSGPKKSATATPPIQASSSDEADFIKKFMEEQEKQEKK